MNTKTMIICGVERKVNTVRGFACWTRKGSLAKVFRNYEQAVAYQQANPDVTIKYKLVPVA